MSETESVIAVFLTGLLLFGSLCEIIEKGMKGDKW